MQLPLKIKLRYLNRGYVISLLIIWLAYLVLLAAPATGDFYRYFPLTQAKSTNVVPILYNPPAPTIIKNQLSCTNGSPTCTVPDNTQVKFGAGDVNKGIIILGQAPDYQSLHAYTYNNVIQPLAQNAGNHLYLNVESGTSGAAASPVPSDWVASTGTISFGAIKPLTNNAGGFVYVAQSAGCISGTVNPTFNQTPASITVEGNTVAGGTICSWTNVGTSTWPQKPGARFCETSTGPCWADAGGLNPATQTFNGCILTVTDGKTINLGTWVGGVCTSANFTFATQSGMYAYYQADSLAALNSIAAGCSANQVAPYAGACKIQVTGPMLMTNTFNIFATAMEIMGMGMVANIKNATSVSPVTGSPWIWNGGNVPMINIQGPGAKVHDFPMLGSDLPSARPSAYFQFGQCGSGYGVTSFNLIENIVDQSQQFFPGMAGDWVGDDIMFRTGGACTQNDRTIFHNVRVGRPGRSCWAALQQQSVNDTIVDSSCFNSPIDVYMPNGGEWYANHLEEVGVGETAWIGRGGRLTWENMDPQPGSSDPIPKGLVYFQDNGGGSGGGRFQINGVGTILPSLGITTADVSLTTNPALVDPHTVHAATMVDTDTDAVTELYIGPATRWQEAGQPYRGTTPWLIRGPDIASNSSRILWSDGPGLQTSNIAMNTSNPRSFHKVHICEGPAAGTAGNSPTVCSTNILTGTDTYALMRHDIEASTNFLGGGTTLPWLGIPTILQGTCGGQGGTVGNAPGDLYYRVASIKTDINGVQKQTPLSVSFKTVFDGAHGCITPTALVPTSIAWLCQPGATQYAIMRCQTALDGDNECNVSPYDTVDAFSANASGDLLGNPCVYTDTGSPSTTPGAQVFVNQTGNMTVAGKANFGQPPTATGDSLGQGYPLGKITAALLPTYKQLVLTGSPGAYYPAGEASGNLTDASGNGNTATAAGAPTYGQTGPIVDDPTTAIAFAAATDKFSVADNASLPKADILSYALWFKATALNRTSILIQQGANGAFLEMVPTGQIAFGKNGGGTIMACGSITDTTRYHFIVTTKNGTAMHCLIDNEDGTNIVGNQTLAPADASFTIGAAATDADGTIGQVAIYKTVLTSAQINALYLLGPQPKYGTHYYDTTNSCTTDLVLGNWTNYHCGNRTVGAGANILPTCTTALQGACANVTDDNAACTFGTTATSGGATYCPLGCDGSNWKAGYCGG